MRDETLYSLFDYLGKPAGPQLGNEVYEVAKEKGLTGKIEERHVKTRYYEGKVLLYPKWFLVEYFNKN
tara:strand:- start:440 stop:643 length:204 start_codon:yes stop_codon:yes gene_type:complete